MDALARTFVGIKLPNEFRTLIADLEMNIRRKAMSDQIRWTPFEEKMITLASPGELRHEKLLQIAESVKAIGSEFQPFRLKLEGLTGLPNPTQPRYVCVTLTGDVDALHSLQARVMQVVTSIVGPFDTKPFQAHVVLGRLKIESEQARTALGRGVKMVQNVDLGEFEVKSIDVLKSTASTLGITFMPIEHIPLGEVSRSVF